MQRNNSLGKKIRRRRFRLFPCLAGMTLCLLMCCGIIRQLMILNKSDHASDSLELSISNAAVTQEVIDYLANKHYVAGVFPVLYADAEITIGVYRYQGTVTGFTISAIEGIGDEQIKLYKETVNPLVVFNESFFEGILTQDGLSVSASEKAVLRERLGQSNIVMKIGDNLKTELMAAGVINDTSSEKDTMYLDIDQLRELLALSGQESMIKNIRVSLRQRKYAAEIEEEFQQLGYDVQYSYKETLEKNVQSREALYEQLKLIAMIVIFILMTVYYLLKRE